MKRQELAVAALENGTVIDHIPSEKLFQVVALLHLEEMKTSITVGYNLKSKKMGHKSIIKVSNKFFTDDELNLLAVVCPDVSLAVIRDFEVVEKKTVTLPEEMVGIIKCPNPVCITNNEPMRTRFSINKEKGTCRCRYCNKEQSLDNVKLK